MKGSSIKGFTLLNFDFLFRNFSLPPLPLSWKIVLEIFIAGLLLHGTVFMEPHREGDEKIYTALVDQLDKGKGYTLIGSPLLEQGLIPKDQYGGKLFHHPPGGIALFWLFDKVFNLLGFSLLQLFSYSLFFWSMMLLGHFTGVSATKSGLIVLAGLTAFNPIMSHVITKFWLDGPLLAFSTCAVALFTGAVVRGKVPIAIAAGIIFGYAGLIKQTAFLMVPGLVLLTLTLLKPPKLRRFIQYGLCLLVPAITIQLTWVLWECIVVGSPFSGQAGHPLQSLIKSNAYITWVTVVRSPWIYCTVLPRVMWTLVPGFLLYVLLIRDKKITDMGFSLFFWIGTILAVHIFLGFIGYSKLMRYVILAVPPAVLVFTLVMNEAIEKIKSNGVSSLRAKILLAVTAIASISFLLEIAAGMKSALLYNHDIIIPFIGRY